ncbi:hypothetical protein GQ55_4G105200 [Panicum hallii var. hallii]|uniref:Uncharacterized protein n=1 Tax=Panicum hallii var. hallii TaxID=1504633 RepID=A0A2T7DXB4_9POAL|nr:hypothetical protein GQ55_4G105200 [Panicum hallii var. hallii]
MWTSLAAFLRVAGPATWTPRRRTSGRARAYVDARAPSSPLVAVVGGGRLTGTPPAERYRPCGWFVCSI